MNAAMTVEQAQTVRSKVCGDKRHLGSAEARRRAAERNREIGTTVYGAYGCPFCHAWHWGHVPSIEGLQQIADAIRTFAGNGPGSKADDAESATV